MSDSNFFAELQSEFLAEASHMLEQFEETMLSLESGNNQTEDLSQIFRVIHSVKGGAAAVGFTDLAQFAHIAEDLLSILRLEPDFVNAEIISILLKSGDAINRRITGLMNGETAPFETADLQFELKRQLSLINGNESTASSPAKPEISEVPAASSGEDHTNYELLSELMSQMGEPLPEVQHVAAPVPSPQVSNSITPQLAQEEPSPSEPQTKPEAVKVAAKVAQKLGGSIKV
jgi:two-component system chemotaxis sensor kinase CheA